jgi:isopentenyldiphosphate isomerase
MSVDDELFDVVNDHDCVIGCAPRREVHARGLKHRAVHVLVFNPSGEIFLQKRAAGKDTFPHCYDSSASGHLISGEGYDACALRELHEELGLTVSPAALRKHFKITACPETGWEFVWLYSIQGDFTPIPVPSEIESGCFFSVDFVKAWVLQEPDVFAPSFRRVFLELLRREPF